MATRAFNRWLMPVLGAALLFGSYGIAEATGTWVTSGKAAVVAGRLTTADLKGWMTLRQAADGLGVPVAELIALVAAPADAGVTPDTAFKDLEAKVPGFSLTTFREKVAAWQATRNGSAAPGTSDTPTRAPSPSSAPSAGTAAPSAPANPAATATKTGTPTGTSTQAVTGSMTLRQVAQANGITVERLIAECGLPPTTNPDLTLKVLKDTTGTEISAVRDAIARING